VGYLAARLGIRFTHARDSNAAGKSLNFAVSGARTGRAEGFRIRPADSSCGSSGEVLMGRGMLTQVEDFVQHVHSGRLRFDADRTIFFLAGGLNDKTLPTSTSVVNLESQLRELYNTGGRYFLLALLPVKIPSFSEVGLRLNPAITQIPEHLRAELPGAHVTISHWGEYMDRVMERPGDFGITNTTDRCAGRVLYGEEATPCTTPDSYFYYHDGHPSTAVQRIVAQNLEREVNQLRRQ
jgi:phospholipase/lecithinase/hemolysin